MSISYGAVILHLSHCRKAYFSNFQTFKIHKTSTPQNAPKIPSMKINTCKVCKVQHNMLIISIIHSFCTCKVPKSLFANIKIINILATLQLCNLQSWLCGVNFTIGCFFLKIVDSFQVILLNKQTFSQIYICQLLCINFANFVSWQCDSGGFLR